MAPATSTSAATTGAQIHFLRQRVVAIDGERQIAAVSAGVSINVWGVTAGRSPAHKGSPCSPKSTAARTTGRAAPPARVTVAVAAPLTKGTSTNSQPPIPTQPGIGVSATAAAATTTAAITTAISDNGGADENRSRMNFQETVLVAIPKRLHCQSRQAGMGVEGANIVVIASNDLVWGWRPVRTTMISAMDGIPSQRRSGQPEEKAMGSAEGSPESAIPSQGRRLDIWHNELFMGCRRRKVFPT